MPAGAGTHDLNLRLKALIPGSTLRLRGGLAHGAARGACVRPYSSMYCMHDATCQQMHAIMRMWSRAWRAWRVRVHSCRGINGRWNSLASSWKQCFLLFKLSSTFSRHRLGVRIYYETENIHMSLYPPDTPGYATEFSRYSCTTAVDLVRPYLGMNTRMFYLLNLVLNCESMNATCTKFTI